MKIPGAIRAFNKRVLNRLMLRIARSRQTPFAIVYHVGRRSGKPYQTPIIVEPVGTEFLIALTYGTTVDWYRNVVAAGRCQIRWHGMIYMVVRIEPVAPQAALPGFPQPERSILRLLGMRDFITMRYDEVRRPDDA